MPRGRKSQAQKDWEAQERIREINEEAQKRVLAMIPEVIATLAGKADTSGVSELKGSDRSLIESLAAAFVRQANPKGKNLPVDPVVAQARKEARRRMIAILERAKANGDVPIYIVKAKMFLNNTKIDPEFRNEGTKKFHATKIRWDRTPNQAMVPVNEIAKEVFAEYERSIGSPNVEGMPDAPWKNPKSPWVHSPSGIVLAPPVDELPEMQELSASHGKRLFDDPRIETSAGAPRRETAVLGTIAPKVVETTGL